jgi:hypothetical protein
LHHCFRWHFERWTLCMHAKKSWFLCNYVTTNPWNKTYSLHLGKAVIFAFWETNLTNYVAKYINIYDTKLIWLDRYWI